MHRMIQVWQSLTLSFQKDFFTACLDFLVGCPVKVSLYTEILLIKYSYLFVFSGHLNCDLLHSRTYMYFSSPRQCDGCRI